MAKQLISTGQGANDGTGDSLRDGASKVNSNFEELYAAVGNGTSLKINVSGATTGQVLSYNGATFVPASTSAIAYNAVQGDVGLSSASVGNTTLGIVGTDGINTSISGNVVTISGSGSGTGSSGGASVTVSTTPPPSPNPGDLWYDSELGILAVWYNTQSIWVQTNGASVIEEFSGDVDTGVTTFLGLADTPNSFAGNENNTLKVNATGTGIVFSAASQSQDPLSPVEIDNTDSPYDASSYELIFADSTSGSITINLPGTPSSGEEVRVCDVTGQFANNPCTISSTFPIQGLSESLLIDVDRASLGLLFVNATTGWVLKDR
jgi:hypothetical protein